MELISKVREHLYHSKELSSKQYVCPIKPRKGETARFWRESPSHVGPFKNAVDIIIPDPIKNPLPIYAPQSGRIIQLVQQHTEWGESEKYKDKLNYLTVQVGESEFYEIAHIGVNSCKKEDGSLIRIGDEVKEGQLIAQTGANGWMTDTRHTHFMVGKWTDRTKREFQSLRIRWLPSSLKG